MDALTHAQQTDAARGVVEAELYLGIKSTTIILDHGHNSAILALQEHPYGLCPCVTGDVGQSLLNYAIQGCLYRIR